MTSSIAVDEAMQAALRDGNAVREISTGWTKVKEVVHMQKQQSDALRAILTKDSRLRAWSSPATPHNEADEGYTDDSQQVAISFPMISRDV